MKRFVWVYMSVFFLMTMGAGYAEDVQVVDVVVEDEQTVDAALDDPFWQPGGRTVQPQQVWSSDPFGARQRMKEEMAAMDQRFQQMFDDPFFTDPTAVGIQSMTTTYDLGGQRYEDVGDQLILHIPLSGIVPDSFEVAITDRMVTIKGEQETTTDEHFVPGAMPGQVYSTSRSSFYKTFALDGRADPSQYTVEHDAHEVRVVFEKRL